MAQFKRIPQNDVEAINQQYIAGYFPNTQFYVLASDAMRSWNVSMLPLTNAQKIKEILETNGCQVLSHDSLAVVYRDRDGQVKNLMAGAGLLVERQPTLGSHVMEAMEEEADPRRERLVEMLNEYLNETEGGTEHRELDSELLGLAHRLMGVALGNRG